MSVCLIQATAGWLRGAIWRESVLTLVEAVEAICQGHMGHPSVAVRLSSLSALPPALLDTTL